MLRGLVLRLWVDSKASPQQSPPYVLRSWLKSAAVAARHASDYFNALKKRLPSLSKHKRKRMILPMNEAIKLSGKLARVQQAAFVLNEGVIERVRQMDRWDQMTRAAATGMVLLPWLGPGVSPPGMVKVRAGLGRP